MLQHWRSPVPTSLRSMEKQTCTVSFRRNFGLIFDDAMNSKKHFAFAGAVAVAVGLGATAIAQQFVYEAPTAADWAALAKLPDFSGVWERSGVGGGGNAAFGTAPAGGRGAAPQRGAAGNGGQRRGGGGAGARGGGGPTFTP